LQDRTNCCKIKVLRKEMETGFEKDIDNRLSGPIGESIE
jgi:hypothetical protein